MNQSLPFSATRFLACALASAALGLGSIGASSGVEREPEVDDRETVESEAPQPKVGYQIESKLKTESAANSYFFLTNEVHWPEKKELPEPPKPAAPREPVPPKIIKRPVPAEAEAGSKPESTDTAVKGPAPIKQPKSGEPSKPAAAMAAKKQKPPKKPAAAMPDIEKLLQEVRQSAQPKLPSEPSPAATTARGIPGEQPPIYTEVEGSIDMDALAQDLAALQKKDPADLTGKPGRPAAADSKLSETSWWMISAMITGLAAAVYGIVYGATIALRKRRRQIRSQSQIDAETRAFFDKLLAEQKRRAARPRAEPRPQPSPKTVAPPSLEAPAAPAREPEPPSFEDVLEEQETGPGVYLLPPELAEGEYKEAVKLASMGESPKSIAEKLNLGEGEVRLVLDIARLSRERLQAV